MQIPGKLLRGEVTGPSSLRSGRGLGQSVDPVAHPLADLWAAKFGAEACHWREAGRKEALETGWPGVKLDQRASA